MPDLNSQERTDLINRIIANEPLPASYRDRLFEKVVATKSGGGRQKISFIVPVFNEQHSIAPFLKQIGSTLNTLETKVESEIVFVNDGSTDATELAIRTASRPDNVTIRLVSLSRNFGKDAALAAGLAHAVGDAVIPIDVDLQDDPSVIPEMIEKWEQGAKIVNAKRIDRSSDDVLKRSLASAFYKTFNLLADRPMPENVGDFRLIDREVVVILNEMSERTRFNKALFSWVGFETAEVVYARHPRHNGTTRWSLWKLWNFSLDGIFAASTVPLRIWSYAGMLVALCTALYVIFLFLNVLITGVDVPGYASTVVLIAFFGALNLLSVGLLGEYIGRIYREVQGRPLYIVRSTWQNSEPRLSDQGG